jgi:hypothetical protein
MGRWAVSSRPVVWPHGTRVTDSMGQGGPPRDSMGHHGTPGGSLPEKFTKKSLDFRLHGIDEHHSHVTRTQMRVVGGCPKRPAP